MTTDRAYWELLALDSLDRAERPLGAAAVAACLRRNGVILSEATVGRLLRQLDDQRLTSPMNKTKGRVITTRGRARLEELRRQRARDRHGARLVSAASTQDINELIDLLRVRRLIEVESAALAALRATDDEIRQIVRMSELPLEEAKSGNEISTTSIAFHRKLAEAAHSPMLSAVTLLLLDSVNDPLERLLEDLAIRAGVIIDHVTDHRTIAAAITARDAQAAAHAMTSHMDKLIDVAATAHLETSIEGALLAGSRAPTT